VTGTVGRKALAGQVVDALRAAYPDADCELHFTTPLDLLVATILSAQCTDERVNMVTADLFKKYRTAEDYASADPETLEQEIHSTGFFRQKARAIRTMAAMLVDEYGGDVPKDVAAMVKLPGVARKTANVVLGTAYGIPSGIPIDTHVQRLAHRIGLSDEEKPEAIEHDLLALIPQDEWIWFGHALICHGGRQCHARAPECGTCGMADFCLKRGLGTPTRPRRPRNPKIAPSAP
jgi:endonuclease-3